MPSRYNPIPIKGLYGLTFILAACSLLYELVLAQTMAWLSAYTVIWYSLTIGTTLAAMGAGAWFFPRVCRKGPDVRSLFRTELLLSLMGGCSVLLIFGLRILIAYFWLKYQLLNLSAVFVLFYLILVVVIGFLSGLELPLLIRIAKGGRARGHGVTHRVLAADYLGALAAGLVFPLVLVQRFDLVTIACLVAAGNLAAAFWIGIGQADEGRPRPGEWVRFGLCTALCAVVLLNTGPLQQYFLQKYYYYEAPSANIGQLFAVNREFPKVERYRSAYQNLDVVPDIGRRDFFTGLFRQYSLRRRRQPLSADRGVTLYIDGDYQFSTDTEELYHEYFAHVPVVFNGRVPEEILVLGAGDGLLVRELLKYPQVRRITVVEIDPVMLQLARRHPALKAASRGALDDPRVHVVLADAFQFVKNAQDDYDAVYMDFPDPKDYNLSKLYSREFYAFVRSHLRPGGFAALDAAGLSLAGRKKGEAPAGWDVYFNTLRAAGFGTVVPYISILETRNRGAREQLEINLQGRKGLLMAEETAAGGRRTRLLEGPETIPRLLADYTEGFQSGFIYLKRESTVPVREFTDPGIDLSVLNPKRFALAVASGRRFPKTRDDSRINSIMRPTLPDTRYWWNFRMP